MVAITFRYKVMYAWANMQKKLSTIIFNVISGVAENANVWDISVLNIYTRAECFGEEPVC